MGEVCYQTIIQGSNAYLMKEAKKRMVVPCGFRVRYCFIKYTRKARHEALNHLEYQFHTRRFRRHDPKGLF